MIDDETRKLAQESFDRLAPRTRPSTEDLRTNDIVFCEEDDGTWTMLKNRFGATFGTYTEEMRDAFIRQHPQSRVLLWHGRKRLLE